MHDFDIPIHLATIRRDDLLRDAARHRTARLARLSGGRHARRARPAHHTEGSVR